MTQNLALLLPRGQASLLEQLRSGNRHAQAEFFRAMSPYVAALVVKTMGPHDGTADVVQEVFEHAFRDVHAVRSADSMRAWLVSLTINRCRTLLRSKRRRWWLSFMEPATLPEVAVEGGSEQEGLVRATYTVLDRLPAEERLALVLRFLEGMTIEEAAEAMSVSIATLKRRVAAARETFMRLAAGDPRLSDWLEGRA